MAAENKYKNMGEVSETETVTRSIEVAKVIIGAIFLKLKTILP